MNRFTSIVCAPAALVLAAQLTGFTQAQTKERTAELGIEAALTGKLGLSVILPDNYVNEPAA